MGILINAIRKSRYTLSTILLLLFLFLPFILRSSFVRIELFPAIILPSGSKKLTVTEKSVPFKHTYLYGYDQQTGELKKLNHTDFMGDIPVWYMGSLARYGFGIDPDLRKSDKIFERNSVITIEDVKAGKSFIKSQLQAQGCSDSALVIRDLVSYFNISSMDIDSVVLEESYSLSLYD